MTIHVGGWGTGNIGRAAIRMEGGRPGLTLGGVIASNPDTVAIDEGEITLLGRPLDVVATTGTGRMLNQVNTNAYCAAAEPRPDEADAGHSRDGITTSRCTVGKTVSHTITTGGYFE
jgi:hypothetical protein